MTFHGKGAENSPRELGAKNVALSLSHTQEQAIAQVILET
jgi:phosphopantetheinyl transferase (holo-ACP synthase)